MYSPKLDHQSRRYSVAEAIKARAAMKQARKWTARARAWAAEGHEDVAASQRNIARLSVRSARSHWTQYLYWRRVYRATESDNPAGAAALLGVTL